MLGTVGQRHQLGGHRHHHRGALEVVVKAHRALDAARDEVTTVISTAQLLEAREPRVPVGHATIPGDDGAQQVLAVFDTVRHDALGSLEAVMSTNATEVL